LQEKQRRLFYCDAKQENIYSQRNKYDPKDQVKVDRSTLASSMCWWVREISWIGSSDNLAGPSQNKLR
jgi:hypothetical protein